LHAHLTGKQLWTNLYRDGSFLKTLESTAFWSNSNQSPTLKEETELKPGDKLVIGGNYDTAKREAAGEKAVVWGLGTKNEMLMSFLFVYPRPARKTKANLNYCGYAGPGITMCTDGTSKTPGVDILDYTSLTVGNMSDPGFVSEFGSSPKCDVSASTSPKNNSDGGSCFPAESTVQMESGEHKRMDKLEVGDRVLVGDGTFSHVFMFTHKVGDEVCREFVRITTDSGNTIVATNGHYIPTVGKGLSAAGSVCVGDRLLVSASGGGLTSATVTYTERVTRNGLYNPQTARGDIVVDGIVASTYTTAVEPRLAHAILTPLRALYRWFGMYSSGLESGSGVLSALAPAGHLCIL
jgi:Hint module/Copper type II ascorbate-dependent monooxygenase, C-terminal domain